MVRVQIIRPFGFQSTDNQEGEMTTLVLTRPPIVLKDYQGVTISTHEHEFQATVDAELQPEGVYTIERPLTTITIEA